MSNTIQSLFFCLCTLDSSFTATLSGQGGKNSALEFTKQSRDEQHETHAKSRQLYSWEISNEPLDVSINMAMPSNITAERKYIFRSIK